MKAMVSRTLALLMTLYTASLAEPSFVPPVSFEVADQRADEVLAKLTTAQKLELISGYNSFFIKGFPEYGIPQLYLSDATQGVNIRRNLSQQLERSTAFPAPIGLAATWNPGLAYDYSHSIGEECRAGGIAVLLGPGMNIYRISQCGRNFEYFGEDPFLAARLVERYVTGVLDTGTIPTLKHFLANNTDYYRRTSNSIVDERTLHEIYLPAFKAGIDAGAMAVMTSYNQVNGEWAGQSEYVIQQLLRNELGFRWLVMTDWWSVWDAKKIIKSGQDLEMPGEKFIKADGARLLESGEVTSAQIERMAKSIVRTCLAMGLYDRPVKDESLLEKFPAHEKVALQTAREAIVLLKNADDILPLKKAGNKKILLTGRFVETLAHGGGSGEVEGYNNITLLQALQDVYGDRLEYIKEPTDAQLGAADLVLASTGTFDSESWDRPFALPERDEAAVKRAVTLNPRTIVIVYSGGGIQMTDWNDAAAAILYAWYPGQVGNRALAEIISGEVNPSGKLPITIEKHFGESPGANYIPAGEQLYAGWEQDNNMAHPINDIHYKEGVFVGYRWYEEKGIEPLYAFGHGLSYTTFEYRNLKITPGKLRRDGRVAVEFNLTNTGTRRGAEVVQLYTHQAKASVPRPAKELKGFSKIVLEPGETRTVRIRVTARDLGFWDVRHHAWNTEADDYQILVGPASDRIALQGNVQVE